MERKNLLQKNEGKSLIRRMVGIGTAGLLALLSAASGCASPSHVVYGGRVLRVGDRVKIGGRIYTVDNIWWNGKTFGTREGYVFDCP